MRASTPTLKLTFITHCDGPCDVYFIEMGGVLHPHVAHCSASPFFGFQLF